MRPRPIIPASNILDMDVTSLLRVPTPAGTGPATLAAPVAGASQRDEGAKTRHYESANDQKAHTVPRSLQNLSTLNDTKQNHHDRDDQQNVDQPTQRVRGGQAECPEKD